MLDKPNLIIISSEQFGHHIDTYYYCRYLSNDFKVTYICWDHGAPRLALEGIEVIYVPRVGAARRVIRFLRAVRQTIESLDALNTTVIFNNYMKVMSTLIRVQHWRHKFVLDIRTGDVSPNRWVRMLKNGLMRAECALCSHVTVISEGLASRLGLAGKAYILPLGADQIAIGDRRFDIPRVLYVGTLYNRNLDIAVRGFADYLKQAPPGVKLTIVGGSRGAEESELRDLVQVLDLADRISVVGPIPHDQLAPYFEDHNVGLSYIPMTPYYDVQPPTKTFEYLLSGMAVVATATEENAKVISSKNGVLINDNPDGVSKGLKILEDRFKDMNSPQIRSDASKHRWSEIAVDLRNYLLNVLSANEVSNFGDHSD